MAWQGHRVALGFLAGAVAAWGMVLFVAVKAAVPPEGGGRVLALFPPGRSSEANFAAIAASEGRPIGSLWTRMLWVVDVDRGGAAKLKAAGALAVFKEVPLAGTLGCAYPAASSSRALHDAIWR